VRRAAAPFVVLLLLLSAAPARALTPDDPGLLTPWFAMVFDRLQRWLEGGPAAVPAAVREAWRARA